MKKLLLFCLLSVFVSMVYIANAQSPGAGCCFWLENADPDRPEDLYSLNPMSSSQDEIQYYYFKFNNSCGLNTNDKISIDWQITVNGQPLDTINALYLNNENETKHPNYPNYYVPSGQLKSGQGLSSSL